MINQHNKLAGNRGEDKFGCVFIAVGFFFFSISYYFLPWVDIYTTYDYIIVKLQDIVKDYPSIGNYASISFDMAFLAFILGMLQYYTRGSKTKILGIFAILITLIPIFILLYIEITLTEIYSSGSPSSGIILSPLFLGIQLMGIIMNTLSVSYTPGVPNFGQIKWLMFMSAPLILLTIPFWYLLEYSIVIEIICSLFFSLILIKLIGLSERMYHSNVYSISIIKSKMRKYVALLAILISCFSTLILTMEYWNEYSLERMYYENYRLRGMYEYAEQYKQLSTLSLFGIFFTLFITIIYIGLYLNRVYFDVEKSLEYIRSPCFIPMDVALFSIIFLAISRFISFMWLATINIERIPNYPVILDTITVSFFLLVLFISFLFIRLSRIYKKLF